MTTATKISAALFVAFLLLIGTHRADALPIYGVSLVSGENRLVRFENTTPGTINLDIPITGLQPTEMIQSIDFRPLTGQRGQQCRRKHSNQCQQRRAQRYP